MIKKNRKLILDIFNYSNKKLCTLYDNSLNVNGQAYNIYINTERNGWKELTFNIPYVIQEDDKEIINYRIDYLKPGFKIRVIDSEGEDWFTVNKPSTNHTGKKISLSVTAGHCSQVLKTKNLGLEFSDKYGGNIGTAKELLDTVLDGTGWTSGYVETFLEDRSNDIKKRTLNCSAKTGAFKMISSICELFEAKPVFHGDTKTVDIIPMNPFKLNSEGIPDVSSAEDSVIELSYSKNLKNVTRNQDFSNVVTKMYVQGSFGDVVTGYCGIENINHTEYVASVDNLSKGYHWFKVKDDSNVDVIRHFYVETDINVGCKIHYSLLDPSSMSYVWVEVDDDSVFGNIKDLYFSDVDSFDVLEDNYNVNGKAFFVNKTSKGEEITGFGKEEVQNWYSFIFDLTYFSEVELLDDYCLQKVAVYQRFSNCLKRLINESSKAAQVVSNDLNKTIGTNLYCRIAVKDFGQDDNGDMILYLNTDDYENGIIYRTDYDVPDKEKFTFNITEELKENGDPVNGGASMLFAVKDGTPIKWFKAYLKNKNAQTNPDVLTFHIQKPEELDEDCVFYLFASNSINGLLGAYEVQYEASEQSLAEKVKSGTMEHKVYYLFDDDPLPDLSKEIPSGDNDLPFPSWYVSNPYCWAWKTYLKENKESEFYFCYYGVSSGEGDNTVEYETTFKKVYVIKGDLPKSIDTSKGYGYLYNIEKNMLYRIKGSSFVYLDSEEEKIATTSFSSVYGNLINRDLVLKGMHEFYTYEVPKDTEFKKGNYGMVIPDGRYVIFTNDLDDVNNAIITYNTNKGMIEVVSDISVIHESMEFTPGDINIIGELIESTSRVRTDYLSVYGNSTYTITGYNIGDVDVHQYIKNGDSYDYVGVIKKVSGYEGNFTTSQYVTDIILSTPYNSNNNNFNIQVLNDYLSGLKINAGVIKTIKPTSVATDKIERHKDNCIIKQNTTQARVGYINETDGSEETQNTNYTSSEFISVMPNTDYVISGLKNGSSTISYVLHFYDKNNRWISCVSSNDLLDGEFSTAGGVYFIRLCTPDIKGNIESLSNILTQSNISAKYKNDLIIVKDVNYFILNDIKGSGKLKGIIPFVEDFYNLSELYYTVYIKEIKEYQDASKQLDNSLSDTLGEMLREGYLQKSNYVKGDEEKLYCDGLDSLKQVSHPETTYNIGYLDLAGLPGEEYYFYEEQYDFSWPELDIKSAIHLVDQEIGVNCWAYVDKIQKCYDVPKNTKITINTKLSTMSQHSFTDVMTNIANVASSIKGKESVIDRSFYIGENGELDASKIKGDLDLRNVTLNGFNSGFKTTDDGNMLFETANGSSAMMLSGEGFKIANSKDENGNWVWRTFGDGNGFSADEISAGTLKANLIQSGSITVDKVDSTFASSLDLSSNQAVNLAAKTAETLTNSSIYIGKDVINISSGGNLVLSAGSSLSISSSNLIVDEDGVQLRKEEITTSIGPLGIKAGTFNVDQNGDVSYKMYPSDYIEDDYTDPENPIEVDDGTLSLYENVFKLNTGIRTVNEDGGLVLHDGRVITISDGKFVIS